jgi:hypothetical protein
MAAPSYSRFLSPPTADPQASPPTVVTARALDKLDELLALPTDTSDGNRMRATANTVLNTQTRVDEMRLRHRSNPDIMSKIIQMLKEEQEKLAPQRGQTPWTTKMNARPR